MELQEIWKEIPGFEGRYEASDQGRVRSVDNYVACGAAGIGRRLVKGRVLKPGRTSTGHVTVAVGKGNSLGVHALVMLAFEGPAPEGHEVLHLNHTPSDNRRGNLRYGTRGENLVMDYANGSRARGDVAATSVASGESLIFRSVKEAVACLKLAGVSAVQQALSGKLKTAYGYRWSRK